MRFEPKTEAEIITESLLPLGVYDIEVREAHDKVSRAGNDMIHLRMVAFDDAGNTVPLDDYLLETTALKLRRAAFAFGLGEEYQAGDLHAHDFKDKASRAKIGIEKGKPKDDGSGESYPDKNRVLDYLIAERSTSPPPPPPARPQALTRAAMASNKDNNAHDDDIPF